MKAAHSREMNGFRIFFRRVARQGSKGMAAAFRSSRFAGVAFAALAGLAFAGAARAETLRAQYSISLLGLPIGQATASGSVDRSAYKLKIDTRLTGLAAVMSEFKAVLVASGGMGAKGPLPAAFASTTATSKETRTLRMALDAGTVKGLEIAPPWIDPHPGRIPVAEDDKRNILDPISAMFMTVPAGASPTGPQACNRSIPIFDGYSRFAVTLSYVGERDVKVKGYAGPVAVCSARYVPVSGHRPDRKSTKFMAENRQIEAWLAPVAGTNVVAPLHVTMATMAGTAVINASEFSVAGGSAAAR